MKIFCVGIGGIGLSGVAQILKTEGHDVSGSDESVSEMTQLLVDSGIPVTHCQRKENIDQSIDLLVYSEAVPISNPERRMADELGIKSVSYAYALGMISAGKKTIAITGTHGKTTVTGMLTSILLFAKRDPTILIGSKIDKLNNKNFRVGKSDLFLTEACEYRGNFLLLSPDIVLINNLEPDHLDFFQNAENYYMTFQRLIEKIPRNGILILFDRDIDKLHLGKIRCQSIIISEKQCQSEIFTLNVPGRHNKVNAYAAEAVARVLGIDRNCIRKGLESFNGTWRRFEFKGTVKGGKVYDDYGHHPTEIKVTIQGVRELYSDKRLIIIFQPHQYSRTKYFFDEFTKSFERANEVWITDIYNTRDSQEDLRSVSAKKLADAVNENQQAYYVPFKKISFRIEQVADSNTVFLVMGAGNIHSIFTDIIFD